MKPQQESKKQKAPLSKSYYQNEPKAQTTLKMVECGILDMNTSIEKATVIVGKTKAGKTTSSHYMTHQVLVGGLDQEKQLAYNLKSTNNPQLMKFKVGQQTSKSQTQIPNYFPLSKKQSESSYLIDTPGYGDSQGCFRIISNRFFHYQVFSKVEKMKFIITISYKDMSKIADNMKYAFKYFLKGFFNLMEIKQQIFAATCLLVTNTPNDRTLQDVINLYSKSPILSGELKLIYQQLKNDLISKKKIFIINSPKKEGQTCNIQNKLLSQIESSLKYWQRKVDLTNNEVDMRNINFGLLDCIDAEKKNQFQSDLGDLWAYYEKNIQSDFKSFIQVLKNLVEDCQSREDKSFSCIQQIEKITKKRQQWEQKNSCKDCKQLSRLYLDKKNKAKRQMFELSKQSNSQYQNNAKDGLPIWAAKLKTLMNIQKLTKKFAKAEQIKNYEECYQIENQMKKVFMHFYNLSKLKISLSEAKNNETEQNVKEFCYLMLKNFQISNKMYRLMAGTDISEETLAQKGFYFILQEYPTSIKNILIQINSNGSDRILSKTHKSIKFVDNMSPKQANEIAKFMEETQLFWEETIKYQQYDQLQLQEQDASRKQKQQQRKQRKSFSEWMDLKIIALANSQFLALKKSNSLSLPYIKAIQERRKKIINKIKSTQNSVQMIQKLKVQNNRCIQLIAECLYKHNKLELAASLFDLIFDAYKVFEILDAEQVIMRKNKDMQKLLEHLIKYSQKADKYLKREVAINKAHQAYHIAQQLGDSENTKKINSIIEQIDKGGSNQQLSYREYLNKKICEIEIPQDLSTEIMNLCNANK